MTFARLSPFDKSVIGAVAIVLLLIGATIWRGDQTTAQESAAGLASEASVAVPRAPESHIVYLAVDDQATNQLLLAEVSAPGAQPSTPITLTNAASGVWDFTTDPTRSTLVYSALRPDGGADLWRAVAGGESALFLACPAAACSTPAFSHDGALLAYSQRAVTGQTLAMINPPRLWLLDVATGESAALFSDSQRLGFDPAFSANGEWLSYVAAAEQAVGLVHLRDGRELMLAGGTGENGAWRPDQPEFVSTHVVTQSALYDTHLIATNPETGERKDLSANAAPVYDDSPAYSPDGAWIAFRRKYAEGEKMTPGKQIWIMRADGSEARALTDSADHDHAPPQWSSDGSRLTFHRYNVRNAPIVLAVMVYDVESGAYWEAAVPGQDPQWIHP